MPAKTREEAIAARIALGAKRGKIPKAKLRGASLEMYNSMDLKQLREMTRNFITVTNPTCKVINFGTDSFR